MFVPKFLMYVWYALLSMLVAVALAGCTGGPSGPSGPTSLATVDSDLPIRVPGRFETEFNNQYGLRAIGADRAYQRGYFGQGVTVGIVDSGMLTTHPEFAGRVVPGYNFANTTSVVNDAVGHGTFVAGVIGAARDGSGVHGVAPSASLMPLQIGDSASGFLTGDLSETYRYAADRNVHVLNNSFGTSGGLLAGTYQGKTISFISPLLRFSLQNPTVSVQVGNFVNSVSVIIRDEDTVLVWAAGNEGWHEGGEVEYCESSNYLNCIFGTISLSTATPESLIVDFDSKNYSGEYAYGRFATLNINPNSVSGESLAPAYEASLLGKWVAVVATDSNNQIASFSSGCGEARSWCIAAPGVSITSTSGSGGYEMGDGTSYSAPHVSGALAVLKSRLPDMPMSAILAILFETAEDLGAPGIDDVYGHGLVDLDRATSFQSSAALAIPAGGINSLGTSRSLLSESKVRFSPVMLGFQRRLSGVSVAVEYLDGYYYNMPLSGVLGTSSSALPDLGQAASDMLSGSRETALGYGFFAVTDETTGEFLRADYDGDMLRFSYRLCSDCVPSVWEAFDNDELSRPFYADSGQDVAFGLKLGEDWELFALAGLDEDGRETVYERLGLRWRQELSNWGGIQTALSRTTEKGTLLGGEYSGAFSVSGSETYQSDILAHASLSDHWRLVGTYQLGWVASEKVSGSIIRGISSLRYDGWRLGLDGESLLRGGDRLRLGVTAHPSIRRGHAHLVYGQASGEEKFVEDYHLNLEDSYNTIHNNVSLVGDSALTYQLGYLLPLDGGVQMAVGLEHTASELEKDETALSLIWIWAF